MEVGILEVVIGGIISAITAYLAFRKAMNNMEIKKAELEESQQRRIDDKLESYYDDLREDKQKLEDLVHELSSAVGDWRNKYDDVYTNKEEWRRKADRFEEEAQIHRKRADALERKLKNVLSQHEVEQAKWEQDRKKYLREISDLKKEVNQLLKKLKNTQG